MGEGDGASTYILGTEERRRLQMLERSLDPFTNGSLDAIGVGEGWRCLELGGGGGSVTRQLCARVGPAGRVTAVDLDTRFLDEIGDGNLEVQQRDVVAEGPPGDGYDLVHARLLLMHLPAREKLLEEMVSVLRPGGWLLVEDLDVFPIDPMTEGLYAQVMNAVVTAFLAGNVATTFGRQLPGLFDRAGLEDVVPLCHVLLDRGGTPLTELVKTSIDQMRPVLLAGGATPDLLADVVPLLDDPTQWFHCWSLYSVRGRAPGG